MGSVGLAGEFSGIYPHASPGGWQIVAAPQKHCLPLDGQPPALLQPGMQSAVCRCHRAPLVCVPVGKTTALQQSASGSAVMSVISPGLQTCSRMPGAEGGQAWGYPLRVHLLPGPLAARQLAGWQPRVTCPHWKLLPVGSEPVFVPQWSLR